MKSLLPSFCLCLVIAAFAVAAPVPAPAPTWKVGAASAKITPEGPMWMAGYAGRTKPSEGVELDLFAKAIAIEDSTGSKVVMVTMDLVGVPRNMRLNVAARAQKDYGLEPERLALNASHTHSGPELSTRKNFATGDPALHDAEAAIYTAKLEDTLVRLIGEALKKAVPATLDYGHARCGFAMNRRTPDGKGGYNNFPNPDGPVDHAVPVLKAMDAQGKEIAIVFGYSCHCTTLGLQTFNGDYAGYAQRDLEVAHPGAVALFVNGCSGDQNPYPRNTVPLAETHGHTLATAVNAALGTELHHLTGSLRAAYTEIPLAYSTLPTREELLAKQQSTVKLDAAHATRVLAKLDAEGKLPLDYPYPVQVIRLGDLTWVTLGGEVVVDYSLRLKSEIKDPIVWVSGYSNDVMTYIPSLRVLKEGGYEAGDAMKWGSHPARWSEKVEEQIVGAVHDLRKELE